MKQELQKLATIASAFEKSGNINAGAIVTSAMRKIALFTPAPPSVDPNAANAAQMAKTMPSSQTAASAWGQADSKMKEAEAKFFNALQRANAGDGMAKNLLQTFILQYNNYAQNQKTTGKIV